MGLSKRARASYLLKERRRGWRQGGDDVFAFIVMIKERGAYVEDCAQWLMNRCFKTHSMPSKRAATTLYRFPTATPRHHPLFTTLPVYIFTWRSARPRGAYIPEYESRQAKTFCTVVMLHFRGAERASGVAMPRRRDVPGLASRVLGYQIKHSNKAIRQCTRDSQAAGVSRSTDKLGTCDLEDWFALRGRWFAHDPRGPPPTADWIDDCMQLFPDTNAPICLRAGGDGCLDLSTRCGTVRLLSPGLRLGCLR